MVPLNKSGLVRAKPGNFILKSLNRCFSNYYQVRTWPVFAETVTFDSKEAILAAITLPKFKLHWVETQSKKDSYKQMLIDEMRLFVGENQLVVESEVDAVQSRAEQGGENQRKDHFYDFPSDDDHEGSTSTDTVEVEAAKYLSTAKDLGLPSQVSNYQVTVSEV